MQFSSSGEYCSISFGIVYSANVAHSDTFLILTSYDGAIEGHGIKYKWSGSKGKFEIGDKISEDEI